MTEYARFAVYLAPRGALAAFGAAWLGWDIETGQTPVAPDIPDLPLPREEITATPRKYGFHATIKPPFRLAEGRNEAQLTQAFSTFCAAQNPVTVDTLELAQLGRFLALVPVGDTTTLNALAANTVRALDMFRAPPTEAELTKRRAAGLTPAQDALLLEWGYPSVLNAFRCHFTLTGKLPKAQAAQTHAALAPHIMPLVPKPFPITTLSLCGEGPGGQFHLLHRATLSG